jgi:phenylalanyl-tRNA synthetase beta chain
MRLVVSWLRDFVDVTASAEDIAETIGLRGFEVAAVETLGDGDAVIDFEVTANRPDCLSVVGLAREVATAYDLPIVLPSSAIGAKVRLTPVLTGASDRLNVTIEDADLCPRYAAAVADVSVGASPEWMRTRLQAAGVRPISSIVDITNYVLLELGQPTHAFDLARLAGSEIRVRRAKRGEIITTLDGVERKLDPDMLVIADRDRAQAVAGVMGGGFSEVSAATKTVAFESAYFSPASVRRTSKRLGLKTEASSRFERGADIGAAVVALERIAALLEQLATGAVAGPVVDVYPTRRAPGRLHLRRARLAALLGVSVADADVVRILRSLGLDVGVTSDGWDALVPTFRVDLLREVDLIEEVGRHYGFDKLETTFPPMTTPAPAPDPRVPRDQLVRRVMTAGGISEAVTFGFIEAKAADAFAMGPSTGLISIANPLTASFDTLRASLLPGLVDAVARNRRHGRRDVALFEIGARFSASAGETRGLAIAWTGTATPLHWSAPPRPVDFFDVKGIVEGLCRVLGVAPRFEKVTAPFLAPGHAAAVLSAETQVGMIGLLAPAIAEQRDAPRHDSIFVAELSLDLLSRAAEKKSDATHPLPRHPFVVRDLSIVVSDALPAENIHGTIQSAGSDLTAPLVGVSFFDRYQGKGVPEQHVSISVRLTFQAADRTLTDAEVQQGVDAVVAALVREHNAVQR